MNASKHLFGFCGFDKLRRVEKVVKEVLHALQPLLIRKSLLVPLFTDRHFGGCVQLFEPEQNIWASYNLLFSNLSRLRTGVHYNLLFTIQTRLKTDGCWVDQQSRKTMSEMSAG